MNFKNCFFLFTFLIKTMRFLHISDIHLGRKQVGNSGEFARKRYNDFFTAFEFMIDYAIINNLDAVIIAGDLFDKKEINPDTLSNTIMILNKIKEKNIPVLCIEGNHDNFQSDNIQDSWLIYLESLNLIKRPFYTYLDEIYNFTPIVIDNIHFWGIGYNGAFTDIVIDKFEEHISNFQTKNVLITHTAIAGEQLFHGTVKSETIAKLKDKCIYIAGGHFHNFSAFPKNNPFFFVPGSLEYWDIAESHHKKGGIVFDTETSDYIYVESNNRKIINLEIENNFDKPEDFYNNLNEFLNNYNFDTEIIVKIEIMNNAPFFPDAKLIEEMIFSRNAMRVYVKFSNNSYRNSQNVSNNNMLIEEIEEEIISKWHFFSNNVKESVETLKLLKEYQSFNSKENEESFKNVYDVWITKLIEGK